MATKIRGSFAYNRLPASPIVPIARPVQSVAKSVFGERIKTMNSETNSVRTKFEENNAVSERIHVQNQCKTATEREKERVRERGGLRRSDIFTKK